MSIARDDPPEGSAVPLSLDRYSLCPTCQANGVDPAPRLIVVNSRIRAGARIQYLGCTRCGFRPADNKRIIPLTFAPPQSHRSN